ncbi:MAG TPA: FecR domain-containing protein [Niabella sp.]
MVYTVEELTINDSFIAYCTGQNEKDIAFWNAYLYQHPEELLTIEEARKLVLGLRYMLHKKQNELSADDAQPGQSLYAVPGKKRSQRSYRKQPEQPAIIRGKKGWFVAASVILLLGTGLWFFYQQPSRPGKGNNRLSAQITVPVPGDSIQAKQGEYKTIILSDGTKVTLNAQSALLISEGFGTNDRNVRLTGEAFFEVAHNRLLPFIVQVSRYKIKAVGTKFNVKAYSNDPYSETALLEGKVQILFSNGNRDRVYKTLQINQKFVLDNTTNSDRPVPAKQDVVPLSYDDAHQNIETAWVDHFLTFDNTPLSEIKNILERKYNTVIIIENNDVANYSYTGSFQNEGIDEVLKALQLSYPFSYKKDGNTIIINK